MLLSLFPFPAATLYNELSSVTKNGIGMRQSGLVSQGLKGIQLALSRLAVRRSANCQGRLAM